MPRIRNRILVAINFLNYHLWFAVYEVQVGPFLHLARRGGLCYALIKICTEHKYWFKRRLLGMSCAKKFADLRFADWHANEILLFAMAEWALEFADLRTLKPSCLPCPPLKFIRHEKISIADKTCHCVYKCADIWTGSRPLSPVVALTLSYSSEGSPALALSGIIKLKTIAS